MVVLQLAVVMPTVALAVVVVLTVLLPVELSGNFCHNGYIMLSLYTQMLLVWLHIYIYV